MSLPTSLSPGFVGLYANWARTGPSVGPGAFAGNWLGDSVKEDDFLGYCVSYGITSIRIYDLQTMDSGSNFTAPSIAILRAFISKAHDNYGITEVIGVRNIFGANDGINGTSEMLCITNYNAVVNANERFDGGNIENEPWNFPTNPTSPAGTVSAVGVTVTGVGTTFTTSTAVKRFIKVAGQYRQVIAIANNLSLTIDRPFSPAIPAGSTWQDYNTVTNGTARFNYTVDYDTYIYRAGLCASILNTAGIEIELYISRNSSNSFLQQLASVCPSTAGRILITQFQVNPNYNYDRNAVQQICSAGIPVRLAFLCSVESTDFHAGCDDPGSCSPDTNSNFLGFFMEGKNSSGVATYAAKSFQDLWDYLTKPSPYTNTPTPSNLGTGANPSANEETNALVIANAIWDGIVIFDQGILRQLVIEPPDPFGASITVHTDITCNGANDGALTVSPFGGTGPFTYAWSGPGGFTDTVAAISGLAPGLYTVIVTDTADGSTVTIPNILITEPNIITISGITTAVTCNGGSDGAISSVTPSGGSGTGYTYSWADGPVTANRSGLSAGTYTLTVTDSNGCTGVVPFVITQPAAIVVTAGHTDPTCFNNNNGALTASATGGNGVYVSYAWTGPGGYTSSLQNPTGINTPGVYTCLVTDSNGCTGSGNTTVVRPADITETEVITPPSSYGLSDGTINLTPAGGPSGVYTFYWTLPDGSHPTTEDVTGPAGNYSVVITDGECTRTFNFVMPDAPVPLTAIIDSTTDPICPGSSNGSITAHAINGTAPYDFAWSGPGGYSHTDLGVLSSTISALAPGTYHLVVTDALAATTSPADPVLVQNPVFDDSTSTIQDCTAYGANDGYIHPIITGGSGVYTSYQWTGPGGFTATTQNINNLDPGNYSLLVTDDEGCTDTFPYTILEGPADPLAASPIIFPAVCYGTFTGSINPYVTGGSGSYTYLWTGPNGFSSTDAVITGLEAGAYSCVITDAILGGAPLNIGPLDVTQYDEIIITPTVVYNSPCGPNTRDLSIVVTGTLSDRTDIELYESQSGLVGTGDTYTNLPAGVYTIKVRCYWGPGITDYCYAETTITIYGCLVVTGTTEDVACKGGNVGIAELFVTGGSGSVTYLWSPGGETTNSITNQYAGVYECDVTDTVTGEVKHVSLRILEPYVQLSASVAPHNPTVNGSSDGWIQALPVGGFGRYTYQWDDPAGQTTQVALGLPAGTYNCVVTDSGKCTTTITATLTNPRSTVLVPVDDDTEYVNNFITKRNNIKCCIGSLTDKLSEAILTGNDCEDCISYKLTILQMIYDAIKDWTYSREVIAAVPAVSGNLNTAGNNPVDQPTYLEWTLQVDSNTIVSIAGYYPALYAAALADITSAINSDGRFLASDILPDIGIKITDNSGQGSFLNGKPVDLIQRYTSLVVNPTLQRDALIPPTDGNCVGAAYDRNRQLTYLSDFFLNQVFVYDINDAVVATLNVGVGPSAIVYRPDTDMVYVFCPGNNTCHKISNLTVVGNFAISPLMIDQADAVYDPSSNKVVVAESYSSGAPTSIFVYDALDVETVIPLVDNIAHSIVYSPNTQRVLCFPRNATQPRQLNTTTNVLSAYALTYPMGTTNIYGCVYVQDGPIDNLFIQTQAALLKYQFGGTFVSQETGFKANSIGYNAQSNLIVGFGALMLQAFNVISNTLIIPFNVYAMPSLCYAKPISREVVAGRNTMIFPAYYFAGSGENSGYVIEIVEQVLTLSSVMSGGVDSYNIFTYDNCAVNADYDELLLLAAEICCGEGCGCCDDH